MIVCIFEHVRSDGRLMTDLPWAIVAIDQRQVLARVRTPAHVLCVLEPRHGTRRAVCIDYNFRQAPGLRIIGACDKQVLSAKGFKRVGRHSEYAI